MPSENQYPPVTQKWNRLFPRGFDGRAIETYIRCVEPNIQHQAIDPISNRENHEAIASLPLHHEDWFLPVLSVLRSVGLDFVVKLVCESTPFHRAHGEARLLIGYDINNSDAHQNIFSAACSLLSAYGRLWTAQWIAADLRSSISKDIQTMISQHRENMLDVIELCFRYEFMQRIDDNVSMEIPLTQLKSSKETVHSEIRSLRNEIKYLADGARNGSLSCEMIGYYYPFWQRDWFIEAGGQRGRECWLT